MSPQPVYKEELELPPLSPSSVMDKQAYLELRRLRQIYKPPPGFKKHCLSTIQQEVKRKIVQLR